MTQTVGLPETVFYDGTCGLCHGWVKFVIKRDRAGSRFVFAPLQGETFANRVSENQRADLPDSIIVQTRDDELLVKSNAVLYIFRSLGGFWRLLAVVSGIIPRALRDFVYDRIAAIRHRLFKKPDDACPLMPPELRDRFKF